MGAAPTRRDAAWFAALAGLAFLVVSLREPFGSEVRYVEAAREMVASGDWVVPHLAYVPYLEKPILAYWLDALAQLAFGESAPAARLPSTLASLACALIAFRWGFDLGGRRIAWLGGALTAAAGQFLVMSSTTTTDPLLALWLVAAWWCFWRHDRRDGRGWIWGFWACVGLACLTKGPLALALTGGGIGLYLVAGRRLGEIARARLVVGALVVLAINVPWWCLVWRSDPRLVWFFFVRENFLAFFDGSINHAEPPWFYAYVLPAGLMPWTAPIVVGVARACALAARAARAAWRGDAAALADRARAGALLPASLVVFTLLFLTACASKLWTYVMPILPPLALIAALGCVGARARVLAAAFAVDAAILAVGAVVGAFVARHRWPEAVGPAVLVGGGIAAAVLVTAQVAAARIAARGGVERALAVAGAPFVAALLVLVPLSGRFVANAQYDDAAARVARAAGPDDRFVLTPSFAQEFSIVRALRRRPSYHRWVRELGFGHFLQYAPPGAPIPAKPGDIDGDDLPNDPWLLTDAGLAAACAGPTRIWYFATEKLVAELRARGVPLVIVDRASDLVVAVNHPPAPATP